MGGAARRTSAFATERINAAAERVDMVTLDTGAFFFGSGPMFSTFRGEGSTTLMKAIGYDGTTLTFRDFTAGVQGDDPTGGELLAEFIANTGGAAAVATNMRIPATDLYLNSNNLVRHKLIRLPIVSPP
jgi:hypothetical protein